MPESTLCCGEKLRNDRRLTVHELANEVGISIGSCYEILIENLQMQRIAPKPVLRLLTMKQKENRSTIYQELKNRSADDNFIRNIIAGDETWAYRYDPVPHSPYSPDLAPYGSFFRNSNLNLRTTVSKCRGN